MAVAQAEQKTIKIEIPEPWEGAQHDFVYCDAKRIMIKAGRRGGKTEGLAIRHCIKLLQGHRCLYGTPTAEQVDKYWSVVSGVFAPLIKAGIYSKNETKHIIEKPGTEARLKAKTCWNANTLRGDYADELALDEFQNMGEDTWEDVGAPMMLDNNGTAIFIFTPPSLMSTGGSKARDPKHASKMFRTVSKDITGRWKTFHFKSHDNPHISTEALQEITKDMTLDSYRREILAEDEDIEKSWLVYGTFREETQLINPMPLHPSWPRYVFHDFGQANPAALFVAQDPGTGQFYIYDEYLPGPGKSMFEHAEEWKKRTIGLNVLLRIGGNKNVEGEIRQGYLAHGWPIMEPKWKPGYQIQLTQLMMERNKIFIFKTLSYIRDELANCLWELDENNKPLDKIKNESRFHLCSCLRYGFSYFTPETVVRSAIRTPITYNTGRWDTNVRQPVGYIRRGEYGR